MDLVARAAESFAVAAVGGVEDRTYELLGARVRVRYVGSDLLAALHPALEHRSTESGGADLVLHVWDAAASGAPPPPEPTGADPGSGQGWYAHEGARRALWRSGQLHVLDGETGTGWLWLTDGGSVDLGVTSAPFRPILEWWARGRGLERVHAGSVATPAGGVLIVGVGGSGKSTTALAAARAGLDFAGDDTVFVSLDDGPTVHSVYNTVKLEADHARRLPWLDGAVSPAGREGDEKAMVYVNRLWPERCAERFPLRAVACARVSGASSTRVRPLAGARALARMAPSSVVIQAGDRAASLQVLADLVRQVPCFELESGTDLDEVVAAVTALAGGCAGDGA